MAVVVVAVVIVSIIFIIIPNYNHYSLILRIWWLLLLLWLLSFVEIIILIIISLLRNIETWTGVYTSNFLNVSHRFDSPLVAVGCEAVGSRAQWSGAALMGVGLLFTVGENVLWRCVKVQRWGCSYSRIIIWDIVWDIFCMGCTCGGINNYNGMIIMGLHWDDLILDGDNMEYYITIWDIIMRCQ